MDNSNIVDLYYDDPLGFVIDVLKANPNKEQREVLEAIMVHNRIAIKSGHGIGKTALLAFIILIRL